MVKQVEPQVESSMPQKQHKGVRFDAPAEVQETNKRTWPVNAVVYIGHLPHGFLEEQLKSYFGQYGQVLAVKVGRSRTTARSKGYAFLQFKYPQVANIVSDAMNGYLLLGKVLVSHTLNPSQKNPFWFSTSSQYKFINWKRLHLNRQQEPKTEEQTAHLIHGLLKNEEKRRQKFKELGIAYEFPGFSSYIPEEPKQVAKPIEKKKDKSKKKGQ